MKPEALTYNQVAETAETRTAESIYAAQNPEMQGFIRTILLKMQGDNSRANTPDEFSHEPIDKPNR